jgi:hypothetical protein
MFSIPLNQFQKLGWESLEYFWKRRDTFARRAAFAFEICGIRAFQGIFGQLELACPRRTKPKLESISVFGNHVTHQISGRKNLKPTAVDSGGEIELIGDKNFNFASSLLIFKIFQFCFLGVVHC